MWRCSEQEEPRSSRRLEHTHGAHKTFFFATLCHLPSLLCNLHIGVGLNKNFLEWTRGVLVVWQIAATLSHTPTSPHFCPGGFWGGFGVDSGVKGVCYMAPIWFHLNLYLIIDIHVFLINIPFNLIYMNSSISIGLFLDIEIRIDSILISPWAPGTCAAVLCRCCYIYTNNCWMTPELFLNTHPSFLWPDIPLPC